MHSNCRVRQLGCYGTECTSPRGWHPACDMSRRSERGGRKKERVKERLTLGQQARIKALQVAGAKKKKKWSRARCGCEAALEGASRLFGGSPTLTRDCRPCGCQSAVVEAILIRKHSVSSRRIRSPGGTSSDPFDSLPHGYRLLAVAKLLASWTVSHLNVDRPMSLNILVVPLLRARAARMPTLQASGFKSQT